MIENIKKHKGTFILSCCLILIAILSAKQYLLTGKITYRRWTSPEGTGLVMSGWQALGVIFGEATVGAYGLILVIKKTDQQRQLGRKRIKEMERQYPGIKGNLEVVASEEEDKEFGEKWQEVVISGDPEGLRSFAELLLALADLDQSKLHDYPDYASEHVHLEADFQLSGNSARLIVGRLDPKGGGKFHDGFKPRKHKEYRPAS